MKKFFIAFLAVYIAIESPAQKYQGGLIDKTIAVVGAEYITLSDLESQVQTMKAQGMASDRNMRCEILEQMLQSKLFLMQARVDSLTVNHEMVQAELTQRIDNVRTALGGDEMVAEYFGKPVYKLRQEWSAQLEEMSLTQQEQQQIASAIPELTPYDVKSYLDTIDVSVLPEIPAKYQMSQICVYPDRDAAKLAIKEKLLDLRARIINGEKFATMARLYSEDPGSARKGGELGMASRSIFWPEFSDAAMALKPGMISQIVETPDGFHIIEVLDKKGDMFNARHILLKPRYTVEDREKAFARLDSIRTAIDTSGITFELAARFYSEDPATRTNSGQMADPNTGSAYFDMDQIKPQDYMAVKDLKIGEISRPVESVDNEGRDGNTVYKIIRLDRIVPAHVATFENDYTELYNNVRSIKQQEALVQFVARKIKETYIVIDPLFADCNFKEEGWAGKIRAD
ncbi:MAG: peptidylprolyl isomerase [Bacteroidales bacterium]|nr:peptidylprolyl isomerase [Bacteroidales bacterium]